MKQKKARKLRALIMRVRDGGSLSVLSKSERRQLRMGINVQAQREYRVPGYQTTRAMRTYLKTMTAEAK